MSRRTWIMDDEQVNSGPLRPEIAATAVPTTTGGGNNLAGQIDALLSSLGSKGCDIMRWLILISGKVSE